MKTEFYRLWIWGYGSVQTGTTADMWGMVMRSDQHGTGDGCHHVTEVWLLRLGADCGVCDDLNALIETQFL